MGLRTWMLLSLFAALPVWASEAPCDGQYIAMCASLANREAVLERSDDGIMLFNPRVLTGQLSPELMQLTRPARINQQNFENNIRPLFNALKLELTTIIETSLGRPLAQTPYASIASLQIRVEDRERCTRTNRSPLVASIDPERELVLICPLMSHLQAASLLTVLAHELGHAVDPCRVRGSTPQNFVFTQLSSCLSTQCPRNPDSDEEETYADGVSSSLVQAALARHPGLVTFSPNGQTRFVQYMSYRLVGCEGYNIYPGALALLANRQSAPLLSCVNEGRQRFSCPIP